MIIPAAMNIEAAVDSMATVAAEMKADQTKELVAAMGAQTTKKLGVRFPPSGTFITGYQLGLQTARMLLAGSVELATKGVNPEDVL